MKIMDFEISKSPFLKNFEGVDIYKLNISFLRLKSKFCMLKNFYLYLEHNYQIAKVCLKKFR